MNSPQTPADFSDTPDYVQSLHRGLDVIRAFSRERPAMSLTDLATRTGLSRAVVRRLLLTLEYLGYVSRDIPAGVAGASGRESRLFCLAPRIMELGVGCVASLSVARLALPYMQDVARDINESCSLSVLDGHDIVYVQRVPVRKVMTVSLGIGARLPAFCASMGRVLVANLAEEMRSRWIRSLKVRTHTQFTITDKTELQRELVRVRAQGYAYVEQELEEGLCSMAVPVIDGRGETVAALNAGMSFRAGARAHAMKDVLPALQSAASRIGQRLASGQRAPTGNMAS